METTDMPPIDTIVTTSGPKINPFVYAFALAPILDILGGVWNYNEYNSLTTTLYEDWQSLYKTELVTGITTFVLWGASVGLYSMAAPIMNLVQLVVVGV